MNAVTVSWAAAAVVARERSTSGSAARYVSTANGPTPVTITSAAMEGGRTRALGARGTVGVVVVVISSHDRTKSDEEFRPGHIPRRHTTSEARDRRAQGRRRARPRHGSAVEFPRADDARDRAEPGLHDLDLARQLPRDVVRGLLPPELVHPLPGPGQDYAYAPPGTVHPTAVQRRQDPGAQEPATRVVQRLCRQRHWPLRTRPQHSFVRDAAHRLHEAVKTAPARPRPGVPVRGELSENERGVDGTQPLLRPPKPRERARPGPADEDVRPGDETREGLVVRPEVEPRAPLACRRVHHQRQELLEARRVQAD